MNLKKVPNSSSSASDTAAGSSSSEEDENPAKNSSKSQKFVNWTRNVNMFILCFFLGVITASLIAIFASEYMGFGGKKSRSPFYETGSLLPDPDHLKVVDETQCFTTLDLQKFTLIRDEDPSDDASNAEAIKNLKAALVFKNKGNYEKASKLFKHALALSPKHPSVLNHYGEFLIEIEDDAIEADHMFVKAATFSASGSDDNKRAVMNRHRTALVVEEIDSKTLKAIDLLKKTFLKINSLDSAALRRTKKEAYFQHIYHTVGIEGNTLNLVQTRSILETKLAIGGKSVQEHNEVLGLDAALKYINQTLVDRLPGHITMQDILQIHKRVIGYVDPIEAGIFRQTQVFVGDYIPPHPGHIDILMDRFLSWLNDPETLMMHPVRLAALAHYKLVYIHPFSDGNGEYNYFDA